MEKLSRWKSQALRALETADFWATMVVLHVARGPVMHLALWLQSQEARLLPLIVEKASAVEELRHSGMRRALPATRTEI